MPGAPGADLVAVQPGFALGLLEAALMPTESYMHRIVRGLGGAQ